MGYSQSNKANTAKLLQAFHEVRTQDKNEASRHLPWAQNLREHQKKKPAIKINNILMEYFYKCKKINEEQNIKMLKNDRISNCHAKP